MPVKSLFKWRGWLVLPPVILAFFCFRWELGNDTVAWAIGGPVFLAAVGLRVWAQCHLHYRLHVHKMMTAEGPYRYTRNPIYIANTAMIASLVLMMECAWLVLPAVVWCALVYSAVVRYEEKRLGVNFGEAYRRFTKAVPRWFGVGRAPAQRCVDAFKFAGAAWRAEAHCFLFLLLPAAKELLGG